MTETNFLTRERIEAAAKCAEGYIKHYKGALIDLKQKHEEDWAMWLEGEYEADLNYIENGIENFETLLALANAELERQSVNNDELIKNIKQLADSLRDTLEHDVRPHCHDLAYIGLAMGIDTLEEAAVQTLQERRQP